MNKTLIVRSVLVVLLLATVIGAITSTTPWREKMKSSLSTAQLRGIAMTPTAGITVQGSYVAGLMMHQFSVAISGMYTLWEDILGGSNYSRRTDWSGTAGKFVQGGDTQFGIYGGRNRKFYSSLLDAIYSGGVVPSTGTVYGQPSTIDAIADTEIFLSSGQKLDLPPSNRVSWTYRKNTERCQNSFIQAWRDSDIVITGGLFDGNSDTEYATGNIISATAGGAVLGDLTLLVADSLKGWFIHVIAGLGTGQCRRIATSGVTVGGNSAITTTANWQTIPDATSDFRVTPMHEFRGAINLVESNNVHITGSRIENFPGDGIYIDGGRDIFISDVSIAIPSKWYYMGGYTNGVVDANGCHNLVGRNAITIEAKNSLTPYPCGNPFDTPVDSSAEGEVSNIVINNFNIIGGYCGIDIEEVYHAEFRNITISNGNIYTPTCIGIGVGVHYIENLLVSNVNIKSGTSYVLSLCWPGGGKNVTFTGCHITGKLGVYLNGVSGLTFNGCTFDSTTGSPAIGLYEDVDRLSFYNCTFKDIDQYAIYYGGGSGDTLRSLSIKNNLFVNCGKESNNTYSTIYLAGGVFAKHVEIVGNTFRNAVGTNLPRYPIELHGIDSVYVASNTFEGCNYNYPYFSDCTNIIESGSAHGSATDFNVVDNAARYSNITINDTTFNVTGRNTSIRLGRGFHYTGTPANPESKNQILFGAYRDVINGHRGYGDVLGAKIVGLNYYNYPPLSGSTTGTGLLFHSLSSAATKYDDTKLRMWISNYGIGIVGTDSSRYINFTTNTADTAFLASTSAGSGGYGIRTTAGGIMQTKNLGGSWLNIAASTTSSNPILADGTVSLTANWDAGSHEIRSNTFESDVTTGTAPLTVASTTVATNLNSDAVDGYEGAALANQLQGDGTAGRVVRMCDLHLANGTDPGTLQATLYNRWNGDAVSSTDNIGKGYVGTNFRLDNVGIVFTIRDAAITGTVLAVFEGLKYNASGVNVVVYDGIGTTESYGIDVTFIDLSAACQDITALVDTGNLTVKILYITSL